MCGVWHGGRPRLGVAWAAGRIQGLRGKDLGLAWKGPGGQGRVHGWRGRVHGEKRGSSRKRFTIHTPEIPSFQIV